MADSVSLDVLRALAGFRATNGCAISVYVDLDPSVAPTAGDVDSRFRSLLGEVGRSEGADETRLSREQQQALKADVDRIWRYWEDDFDRDGARGVAIFASQLDGLWRTVRLPDSVPDTVRVGRQIHLAPLLPLIGRGEGALVADISREKGRVWRLTGGRLEEVADESEEQPGQHDQGGWSQARYQRHLEHLVLDHLKSVGEEIEEQAKQLTRARVVIVAPQDMKGEIQLKLSPEVQQSVVGWASAEAHANAQQLLEAVTPVLEQARHEEEQQLSARWQEELGQGGRAAGGWADTLAAASDARVDTLLVAHGSDRAAYSCPQCGRASADGGECPLDGSQLEPYENGVDLAVQQTLANGGNVQTLFGEQLGPHEGIGALLRY